MLHKLHHPFSIHTYKNQQQTEQQQKTVPPFPTESPLRCKVLQGHHALPYDKLSTGLPVSQMTGLCRKQVEN